MKRKISRSLGDESIDSGLDVDVDADRTNANDNSFSSVQSKKSKISFYLYNLSETDQKAAEKLLAEAVYTAGNILN